MKQTHYAYGTTIHTFEFDPECYFWTLEVGKSDKLETLAQIAPDADYVQNWSVFDWNEGKDGYGKIQNGTDIIQEASASFPTVSFVDGKLKKGDYPVANPGFATWRILVQNGAVNIYYVFIGNGNVKDARSAVLQLKNGNCMFIVVEGDDTKKKGMTSRELADFCVSLDAEFACDGDGGGSVAAKDKEGYIYNQGRAIAGAMVLRKKTISEYLLTKVGCGYVWGAPHPYDEIEILTPEKLKYHKSVHEAKHYDFVQKIGNKYINVSAEKWYGEEVGDCSGWITLAGNKLGILNRDYSAIGLWGLCEEVKTPVKDDLCFNDDFTHVGVYLGNNEYLHAKGTYWGVVITDKYTFTKFGRLKGVKPMSWEDKNIEFIKTVQRVIGCSTIDGKAGAETVTKFEQYKNSVGSNEELEEIKKALKTLKEAI